MPTKFTGDYSKYPEEIRDVLPYLEGETCMLRQNWQVHKHLFMSHEARVEMFAKYLGALLGTIQRRLQDEMIIGIGRLTDRDKHSKKNLSMWSLLERCEKWNSKVAASLREGLEKLEFDTADIRTLRNKRLAHFDLPASLGQAALPTVPLAKIRSAIEEIERLLNLVGKRACNTTIGFRLIDHRDITDVAEISLMKAKAFDELEQKGVVSWQDWKKHALE